VSVGVQRVAIAAAAMVMLAGAFFLARAISSHPLAPVLAVIGLAAGPRFFMFSRRILVDMAISAMMTLVLLFFALAERYPDRRRLFLALMYVCVGLGVLTKGPVAAVVPALVFLVYLAVQRELGRIREMMIPVGTLIALAIVVPWYAVLYDQHGWTYITSFFIGENIGRFTETIGVQTRGPDFYLPVVFSDSLPWSLCLPAVVAARWRSRRRPATMDEGERVRTLLLLWIGVSVLFFSFSQTKQDLYIFHIVGAVAALGADWLARTLDGGTASDRRWLTWTLVSLGAVLVALGAFVVYLFGWIGTYRLDGAVLAGTVPLIGGLVIAALTLGRRAWTAVAATLVVFIAFNWVLLVRVLPGFEMYKPVVPLSEIIRRQARPGDVVMHFDVALPSMVFYLRRHIDVTFDPDELHRRITSADRVLAVLPAHRYPQLKMEFGVPTCEIARRATFDIRLRTLLARAPSPEVVLISNRCDGGAHQ
jgi:4-amino-4-deoxy-L-arabinose transferase-like glycosyltransferase